MRRSRGTRERHARLLAATMSVLLLLLRWRRRLLLWWLLGLLLLERPSEDSSRCGSRGRLGLGERRKHLVMRSSAALDRMLHLAAVLVILLR
jgi:hypothetical protein